MAELIPSQNEGKFVLWAHDFANSNEVTNDHEMTEIWRAKWTKFTQLLGGESINSPEKLQLVIGQIHDKEISDFSEYFPQSKYEEFYSKVLPFIQELALSIPNMVSGRKESFPLLSCQRSFSLKLNRKDVACILAAAFFGILPLQTTNLSKKSNVSFHCLSFLHFHSFKNVEALKCLIHYFTRVYHKMPQGFIEIQRKVIEKDHFPDWIKSSKPILPVNVFSKGIIEDSKAPAHVDFANRFIGGLVLTGGLLQEEINFLIKPECLCSILFCERMDDNESIIILGAERFSAHTGYSGNFEFCGDFKDETPYDEKLCMLQNELIAIDSSVAARGKILKYDFFTRDINKAYCGFHQSPFNEIATGNWGCGAFGNDKKTKAIQQVIAASESSKTLHYYTFNDEPLKEYLEKMFNFLIEKQVTVGKLFDFAKRMEDEEEKSNIFDHFE